MVSNVVDDVFVVDVVIADYLGGSRDRVAMMLMAVNSSNHFTNVSLFHRGKCISSIIASIL